MSVLEHVRGLSDPGAAAAEVQALNDRLARERTITGEIAAEVRELASGLSETELRRWNAIDPRHTTVLLHAGLRAHDLIDRCDDREARDRLRIALEEIRQSLAAIAEREPVGDERSPKEIAQWLAARTEVPQARLAELLGVSLRQLQRWVSPSETAQPEGEELRKTRLVARVVDQLRFVLTPAGTVAWFGWPRSDLEGRRPLDLLGAADAEPRLLELAAAMRGMAAS
jgi:hypothetical protein